MVSWKWEKWLHLKGKEVQTAASEEDRVSSRELHRELQQAKKEWDNALRHFDYAVGEEQVDYAIYSIKAAEKKYEMLIRKAKAAQTEWPKWIEEDAI